MPDSIGSLSVTLGLSAAGFVAGLDGAASKMRGFESAASSLKGLDLDQLFKRGDAVTRSVETPIESYRRKIGDLDKLLKVGAIDQETYNRAAAAAKKDLDGAAEGMGMLGKGAIVAAAAVGSLWAAWKAGEAAFDWVREGIDKVADIGREAQRFGVSTEKLSALQFQAGRDAGVWETGLRHLRIQLGDAASGSEEARKKFQLFGLDGRALAAMGTDRALDVIADRFKALGGSADAAKLGEELFGRESAALLPYLEKGAAGLAEADAAAKKFGLSVSSLDAAKALVAQRAMDDLGRSFEGIQQSVAIEFAPLIADVAKGFTDMVTRAGGFKELIKGWGDAARSFVVTLLSGIELIAVKIADMGQKAAALLDKLDKALNPKQAADNKDPTRWNAGWSWWGIPTDKGAIGVLREALSPGSVINSSDAAKTDWGKDVKGLFDSLKDSVSGKGDSGLAGAIRKINDELDKLGKPAGDAAGEMKALLQKRDELINKTDDEIAVYGLAGSAAERFKLARQGLSAAELAGLDATIAELNAIKRLDESTGRGLNIFQQQSSKIADLNAMFQAGAVTIDGFNAEYRKLTEEMSKKVDAAALKVFEDTATPLDKLRADMDNLNQLQALGKISSQQYATELSKEWREVAGAMDKVLHPSGAALEGSVAAYQTVLHARDQSQIGDVQQRIAKGIEAMEKRQAKQLEIDQRIAEAIERVLGKK